jgi:AcrR family transcriptional regulator
MDTESRRATPLPPDDRRRSIVEAVVPLIVEHGASVTTRQMADAAGVAEGTIYKVFPDKPSIIVEAIRVSIDPEPTRTAIEAIPDHLSMEDQVDVAARTLMERGDRLMALVSALGAMPKHAFEDRDGAHRQFEEAQRVVVTALTELFERHERSLQVAPRRAAIVLRGLVFVNNHPRLMPTDRLSATEIVATTLHGVARAPEGGDA